MPTAAKPLSFDPDDPRLPRAPGGAGEGSVMTADEYRIVLSPAWFGRTRADLYYTSHAPSGPQLLARMRARTAERAQAEATSLAGAIQARDGHGSPYWVVVE